MRKSIRVEDNFNNIVNDSRKSVSRIYVTHPRVVSVNKSVVFDEDAGFENIQGILKNNNNKFNSVINTTTTYLPKKNYSKASSNFNMVRNSLNDYKAKENYGRSLLSRF